MFSPLVTTRSTRAVTAALMLLALFFNCTALASQADDAGTDDDEAAHLQRFTGYIEWPERAFDQPASAIVVGIAGSDRTLDTLSRAVKGKQVQGRPVEVRRLEQPDDRLTDVHLAFVGREAWRQLPEWVAACRLHGVVLATNAPDGVARGAVLGLVASGPRMRFEASLPAAAEVGVRLSARLLEVAERVVGGIR